MNIPAAGGWRSWGGRGAVADVRTIAVFAAEEGNTKLCVNKRPKKCYINFSQRQINKKPSLAPTCCC